MSQDFLTNHFLVAMPTLEDPNFHESVTLICEHNAQGALGIMINRPMNVVLEDILKQLALTAQDLNTAATPVHMGGPVQPERGFVIHEPQGEWEATLKVGDALGVTTSRDVLAALATGGGPKRTFVALGYAGWSAGQLDEEIKSNSWLSVPADAGIIFDTPVEQRWQAAARLIGVDLSLLSGDSGHA
ncbi:MAG TPA: YqgE/AlgH family protein [Gammaproteobacteria bacterium]|jgi:putative transcriptional regulator|nr:YqgE/AlgH family protein [Gammaproteobacteria bacterium]